MSIEIRINPMATTDMHDIKAYIAEDSPDSAVKVIRDILSRIESLADFPEMGALLSYKIHLQTDYRYLVCGNYLIFYLYDKNIVSVQRVLHGKRDFAALLYDEPLEQ